MPLIALFTKDGTQLVEFACDGCGKHIIDYACCRNYGKQTAYYCSRECRAKSAAYIEFDCAYCGKHVRDLASRYKGTKQPFCSLACKRSFRPSGKTKKEKDNAAYAADAEDRRQSAKDRYRQNAEEILSRRRERTRALKREVMDAYGGVCQCCGESILEFLTIDHINGGGRAHRERVGESGVYADLKKRGFPQEGYRVLCFNCNTARGYYGYCPHHPEDCQPLARQPRGNKVGRPITVGLNKNPDAAILNEDVIFVRKPTITGGHDES